MNKIFIIYAKELKEILRDKRTLIFMIVFPVLGIPLLFDGLFRMMAQSDAKARTEQLSVAFLNGEQLPELVKAFEMEDDFTIVAPLQSADEVRPTIKEGRAKIVLALIDQAGAQFANQEQVGVLIHYDNASISSKVVSRTQAVLDEFNQKQTRMRLYKAGIKRKSEQESVVESVTLIPAGIATERERIGEAVGGLLPYFFIILCFLGAMHPAIDLGAGEKERGTLETLLLSPVPRLYIVLGKFLVVMTSATTSALLCLVGMMSIMFIRGDSGEGGLDLVLNALSTTDLLLMASMLLPIAAIFSAMLLSISIFARSHKEAQSTAAPLNFLIIFPAIVATLPDVSLDSTWALVPITNVTLAIKEIAKGTLDFNMMILILGSTIVLASAMLAFCVKWFQREEVLFRN